MSFRLSAANKPFMLSVIMLNVVMVSVLMLSVVAPTNKLIEGRSEKVNRSNFQKPK